MIIMPLPVSRNTTSGLHRIGQGRRTKPRRKARTRDDFRKGP
jgi:hypothetical protein